LFSQRHGFTPAQDVLQLEGMTDALRVAIWNAFHLALFASSFEGNSADSVMGNAAFATWAVHLQQPADRRPRTIGEMSRVLNKVIMEVEWFRVYDLIEFVHARLPDHVQERFGEMLNTFLSNERSGYRLVAGEVAPVTAPEELHSIDAAAQSSASEASGHIQKALRLFSDRADPDYANSVKESISAVESACQHVLGQKVTAGDGLKKLKEALELHPALAEGFSKLYGFTSDAGGVRHASRPESAPVGEAEARYFLVTCSAFVNYLLVKHLESAAGLP